jgi:prepilin-type N-terminal cleavage/methylation domain-containing protein
MLTQTRTKAKQGFTLIELLVVISIIGLLSTLAMVALNNARIRSRDAKRLADMNAVSTAMQLYAESNASGFTGACKDSNGNAIALPTQLNTCVGSATSSGIDDFLGSIAQITDPTQTGNCTATATGEANGPCNYTITALSQNSFNIAFWQEGTDGGGKVTEAGVFK